MIDQHQGPSEPAGWPEPEPTAAPTAGIDWASTEHAVAVVDAHGTEQERFVVAHTGPGLRQLVRRLAHAGVAEVGIERPDGPVVERSSRPSSR